MAALISILLEMPKGDAMSSSGFSITTTSRGYQNLQRKKNQSDPGPTARHPDYKNLVANFTNVCRKTVSSVGLIVCQLKQNAACSKLCQRKIQYTLAPKS